MTIKFKRKKLKGMTLIELLMVITVVGLLVLFSVLAAPTQIKKARDAKRKANLEKIKTALYDYYFDADCFPEELPGCGENFGSNGMIYLNNFPCDPNGDPYVYVRSEKEECSQWFRVFTNLEITTDPIIAKIRCTQGCGPDCAHNYGVASTNTQIYRDCFLMYACNPGGVCEAFDNPWISECPVIFDNDPSCNDQCDDPDNRCENDSGKHVPDGE